MSVSCQGSRQILFLQGPPGDFFRDLADALAAHGHEVHRINFNGGDLLTWRFRPSVNYRAGRGGWPAFLVRLLRDRAITDIVLFGDCRPMHRMARAAAAGLGVAVHVFEEGYLRPDWVTLERDGVNGFSPLPSDPGFYRDAGAGLPQLPDAPRLPSSFKRRARATVAYYTAALMLSWAFPRHRTHRPWTPLLEGLGWLARFCHRSAARRRSQAGLGLMATAPYFVFPLQLDSDYQLRAHSDFDGMRSALAQGVASFARHAPPGVRLVVKQHPLDNGLNNWRHQTAQYARALGVDDRVVFLEIGDIDLLVRSALGVVTVNSTTGTLALAAGVPVITLGRAVYDISGLTHQGPLDTFWTHPDKPDLALYDAFRRVLAHQCLLWGGFYDGESRSALIAAATRRILGATSDLSRAPRPAPTPQLKLVQGAVAARERALGAARSQAGLVTVVAPFAETAPKTVSGHAYRLLVEAPVSGGPS